MSLITSQSQSKSKQNLVVDKQTFDTIKVMKDKGDNRSMFDLIYKKSKSLKDDRRLIYFSFGSILRLPEVQLLILFSTLYTVASGINANLVKIDYFESWYPYQYSVYGSTAGLLLVIIFNDLIFRKTMTFAPAFCVAALACFYHLVLYFVALKVNHWSKQSRQWLLFVEGIFDGTVQFYIFFMAPI